MKVQELSRKYATAVFGLLLEKWLEALNVVQTELTNNADLAAVLQDSGRSFNERQKELDAVIPAETVQEAKNFLYTMLRDGDIGLLGEVLADLEKMSRGGPQVQVAYVTSSIALSEDNKDKFRKKLRSQYGHNLEFLFQVDSAIIGGIVVQVGDKIIDGTVASRLSAMNNLLGVKA